MQRLITNVTVLSMDSARQSATAFGTSNVGRIRLEHLRWARGQMSRLQAAGAGVVTRTDALYRAHGRAPDPHHPKPPMRFPVGALRAAGVQVGGSSSDAPCFSMPPLWGVGAAVHRHTMDGEPIDADQAVSLEEALRMHTLGAACADGMEDVEGSITPGKLANFVVDGRRAYCRASTSFITATESTNHAEH